MQPSTCQPAGGRVGGLRGGRGRGGGGPPPGPPGGAPPPPPAPEAGFLPHLRVKQLQQLLLAGGVQHADLAPGVFMQHALRGRPLQARDRGQAWGTHGCGCRAQGASGVPGVGRQGKAWHGPAQARGCAGAP